MGFLLYSAAATTGSEWAKPQVEAPTYPIYTVSMTGYNAVPSQTDDTPFITSIGLPVNPEVGAAASRDLIAGDLPYGTVIELVPDAADRATGGCELPHVEKYIQYRVITDTMNKRHENHVDIQFGKKQYVTIGNNTLNVAKAIGWCNDVEIRVIGKIDIGEIPDTQAELAQLVSTGTIALSK